MEDSWDLNNTVVIIVSHSGGTFGKGLHSFTSELNLSNSRTHM
jgi:membrane-anchored protein YejM (alkaline phosphatase superfamily)